MNRRDAARAAKENAEKTVKSFTRIDDNLWSMIYYNSYGLDSLLKEGSASILDTVRHLQKEVRAPHIAANPDHGGFACSTFNASNPGGDASETTIPDPDNNDAGSSSGSTSDEGTGSNDSNGAIATGQFAGPVLLCTVLIAALGVFYFVRKRRSSK